MIKVSCWKSGHLAYLKRRLLDALSRTANSDGCPWVARYGPRGECSVHVLSLQPSVHGCCSRQGWGLIAQQCCHSRDLFGIQISAKDTACSHSVS